MPSSADAALLKSFQDFGDTASLRDFLQRTGNDMARYDAALRALKPVLGSINHGEYPQFNALDPAQLHVLHPEVAAIATYMAQSDRADLNSAGVELQRLLNQRSGAP